LKKRKGRKAARPRDRERFDEYRRFSDAFDCTFREWLDIRKTQWYDDLKNDRLKPWWQE
jgi:hypothetical protein